MSAALVACPGEWEYENHPRHQYELPNRIAAILRVLRKGDKFKLLNAAQDTRKLHEFTFKNLTPNHFPYFAGNYRGANLRCLQDYEVGIAGDPRVGHPAATIPIEMSDFAIGIGKIVDEIDLVYSSPDALFSKQKKLFRLIQLVAGVFVDFLEVHPYANGNGHMGRILISALLARQQTFLNGKWKHHPRPSEPEYSQAIVDYRAGNKQPLHVLLLNCI